jgi:hypothetical protein
MMDDVNNEFFPQLMDLVFNTLKNELTGHLNLKVSF